MSKLCIHRNLQIRWFATKVKLNENVAEAFENKQLHHKHHPGIVKPRSITIPKWLKKSITNIVEEKQTSIHRIRKDCIDFTKILFKRHPPKEDAEIQKKMKQIHKVYKSKHFNFNDDMEDVDLLKDKNVRRSIKDFISLWSPIKYNSYNGLLYLVGRSLQDYASLCRIFSEIQLKDSEFKPQTLFDFGSGTGTVLWAASLYWSKSLKEQICVDVSTEMTTMSEEIIKQAEPPIKNVFYRHFLSASPVPTYDIVVSAFSLLELPSTKQRLETLLNLWRKTERYLVIVELGTSAGFRVVHEARDFILYQAKEKRNRKGRSKESVHVFLPCPHDLSCPKFATCTKPCNFTISHESLRGMSSAEFKDFQFSYVVLKKEKRPDESEHVRIVGPVRKYKKRVRCRVCTPSGELLETIISKNNSSRHVYRCVRLSRWGDWLPMSMERVIEGTEDATLKMNENLAENVIPEDEEDEENDDDEEGEGEEEEEYEEIEENNEEFRNLRKESEEQAETKSEFSTSTKIEDVIDSKDEVK